MSRIGSLVLHRRVRLASCALVALATGLGLAPMAIQAISSPASAAETALAETGWTASASTNSTGGDVPANAIDGNINTRYSSDADQAAGMWFQVNLGSAQTFNQIEMNSGGSAGDYARGYNVEVSTNGTTFTSVATGTGTSSPETVTFASQTAQYIRVVLTASSTNSSAADAPANAIDGNVSTRFSSDADQASGQYWQLNMGSAQTFNQIEMNSGGSAGDYARGYNVEVSTNGTTFTSVATGTGTSSPETVTFATQTAQYIRVVLTAGVTTNWWSIAEFTVYSSGGGSSGGETQLAETGWTATASTNSTGGDVPANAIDGNINTRYSSDADQAAGMWFQVNLGSAQTFNQIEMNSGGSAGDYARGYNVEVSTNGTTFTTVATGTGTSSPETVTFATQTAQYIRVVLTAGVTTNWWSIAE